jgi:hypothetical protein
MVPGKLFLMDVFQEGAPCPGQSKGNRQMANKLPDSPMEKRCVFFFRSQVNFKVAFLRFSSHFFNDV